MSSHAIHNVRFLSLSPTFAHSLSFSPQTNMLAVSRSDNSIEVWNHSSTAAFLERWFPGNSESSVESLCWAGQKEDRLFSTGLHGLVLEHDLSAHCTKHQFAVTSGPAWCMQYHKGRNRIAVGTEEGYVCLFEVTEDGLLYDKVLDKQEGRILCLAWHSSGDYIVTGGWNWNCSIRKERTDTTVA
jgi:U3 small nucleolar RNA-associated protein 4